MTKLNDTTSFLDFIHTVVF